MVSTKSCPRASAGAFPIPAGAKDVDAVIATLVLVIVYVILAIPAALTVLPWAMITGQADPLYNTAQLINRVALAAAGIRVEVSGRERVPADEACIFMSNHLSNLDPPALFPRIPGRTSAFLKRSLMHIPVLGYGLRLAEFIPVDRNGGVESAQESAAMARRLLAKGIHITIFVEGTRSPDGRMLPFKKGPFYLAMESGARCIPVSIEGTQRIMPKGKASIRPGTAHVTFHAPIDPRQYATREELMDAVREAIASGLPERMRG
ncbi:MAG: lysophospholipid acyltransferase family protein [Terracidiphilus sp.]